MRDKTEPVANFIFGFMFATLFYFILLLYIATIYIPDNEISKSQYREVYTWTQKNSSIKDYVQSLMEDGFISQIEYDKVEEYVIFLKIENDNYKSKLGKKNDI